MISSTLLKFWKEEDGQDLVEYSLLLAFIALAAVALLTTVKGTLSTLWGTINTQLSNANTAAS
jgi:Flp pilus assembly pilin Flp